MTPESPSISLTEVERKIICLGSAADYEKDLRPPPWEMILRICTSLISAVGAEMKMDGTRV